MPKGLNSMEEIFNGVLTPFPKRNLPGIRSVGPSLPAKYHIEFAMANMKPAFLPFLILFNPDFMEGNTYVDLWQRDRSQAVSAIFFFFAIFLIDP